MNENYIKNNINFTGNTQASMQKLPELHKQYNDFVQKINKSDFCNSARRYLTELDYVTQLKVFYTEKKCPDLAKEMTNKEAEILEILKTQFGITYKT